MDAETAPGRVVGDRPRGQRGESLIESLLAIVILSMIVAASYGGLQVAIRASEQQERSAVAGAMLRNAAELLADPDSDYIDRAGCKGAGNYGGLPSEPGYGTVETSVQFIEPPKGGSENAAEAKADLPKKEVDEVESCPEVDPGLQQIELTVITPTGDLEQMQIIKRRQ